MAQISYTYIQSQQSKSTQKQIHSLHFLRGLCLLLVIWDHVGLPFLPFVDHLEVPGFYIMSGMLFKPRDSWNGFLHHVTKRLITPYFKYSIFFILLLLVELVIGSQWIHINIPDTITPSVIIYWIAKPANYPLWMLKAIAWAYIIYRPITLYAKSKKSFFLSIGVFFISSAFGAWIGSIYQSLPEWLLISGLPQGIQALPLMIAGAMIMQLRDHFLYKIPSRLLIIAGIFFIIFAISIFPGYIGMNICNLGTTENFPILFYPRSIFTFLGVLTLSEILPRIAPIEYLSKKSIEVLGLHALAIEAGFFIFGILYP